MFILFIYVYNKCVMFVQNNAEYNNIKNIIKINTKKTSTFQFQIL